MQLIRQLAPVKVGFDANGLGLIESCHEEGFFMDWRKDAFAKILIVVGGKGILYYGQEQLTIEASSLMVIPSMARHRIADLPGNPLSLAGVCIEENSFQDTELLKAACSERRIEADSVLTRQVSDWIRELSVEKRLDRVSSGALQNALVTCILVKLARAQSCRSAGRVDSPLRVENYIQELESEFWRNDTIDTVAAALGLSRRRFTQLFREIAGESWLRRVNRLRLEHAERLLRNTRLSVRSVAFECGYADLSHFYRAFKRRFGISPGKWRH